VVWSSTTQPNHDAATEFSTPKQHQSFLRVISGSRHSVRVFVLLESYAA